MSSPRPLHVSLDRLAAETRATEKALAEREERLAVESRITSAATSAIRIPPASAALPANPNH